MRKVASPGNVRYAASPAIRAAGLAIPLLFLLLAGCAPFGLIRDATGSGLERAAPLGLVLEPPNLNLSTPVPLARYERPDRDDYVLLWIKRSDDLCGPYKSEIIRVSRDSRLASGLLSTTLSGLAAVFTPVGTVRALSAAAAIATGTGAVFQSDAFSGQVGEILTAAIETARRNQANQIKANLNRLGVEQYSIYSALRDVGEYHDMCSLNTALIQVRASLVVSSPDAGLTPPAKQGRQSTGGISPAAAAVVGSASGAGPITDPDAPLPPRPPPRGPVAQVPSGVTPTRVPAQLRIAVSSWQRALCVAPANGDLNAATLRAIREYLDVPADRTEYLGASEVEALGRLADTVENCQAKGYRNVFEVKHYGMGLPGIVARLQGKLNEKLRNVAAPITANGIFDTPTRDAIRKVRELARVNPGLGGEMDNRLDIYLVDTPQPFPNPG